MSKKTIRNEDTFIFVSVSCTPFLVSCFRNLPEEGLILMALSREYGSRSIIAVEVTNWFLGSFCFVYSSFGN